MGIANYWLWLSGGILLMVLEILTPGVFFMWIGIGAFATGLISFIFPAMSNLWLGLVFAALAVISVIAGKKLMSRYISRSKENEVNSSPDRKFTGRTFTVSESIVNGRGKIIVGDSVWQASSDSDIKEGTTVKVIGGDGAVLKVEAVKKQQ